jgi:hypothetical protein
MRRSLGVGISSKGFKDGDIEYTGASEVTELGAVEAVVAGSEGSDSERGGSVSAGDDDIVDILTHKMR